MNTRSAMHIKLWGVRGSFPTPSRNRMDFGGHTSCVEIRCGGQLFILDAGTGLQHLGETLTDERATLLLSHTHIDHVMGLPFFAPLYHNNFTLDIWAGHLLPESTIRATISRLISPPLFPVAIDRFPASIAWHDFAAGETLTHPHFDAAGITVSTHQLSHPDRSTGYRISNGKKALCYITDIEHEEGKIDASLLRFVEGCDTLIYDASFDDRDFTRYRGWGHSTWQQAIRVAKAANASRVILFHHDPTADDAILHERAILAEREYPGAIAAREGIEFTIG